MPAYCAVIGCKSKGHGTGRTFSSFPMLRYQTPKALALTQARQTAWIRALNRKNFFASQFQHARVCDLHFISGKAASYTDVNDPDWAPTLRLGHGECPEMVEVEVETTETGELETSEMDELESSEMDELQNSETVALETSIDMNEAESAINDKANQTHVSTTDASTQTEGTITGISTEIFISYVEQVKMLEEMLQIHNVTLEKFRGDDTKTRFFTGISHFATLEALFELIDPKIAVSKKLTKFQILFIVLSRLRLNLSFRFLSYQFNVAVATISRHFYKCLWQLHNKLRQFVYWPERDAIKETTPLSFKNCFGDTITVIIDCFEIFIEKPNSQKAMAQCYSSYKHAYTVKYLIGITPQGFIAFISKGYGGRCSDKFVTENCGFLPLWLIEDS